MLSPAYLKTKAYREAKREWAYNYLLEHPCVDCGEDNPVVLEFDLLHSKTKRVSDIILYGGMKTLQAEVEKCEVRCANCHRVVTAIDHNWYSAKRRYAV